MSNNKIVVLYDGVGALLRGNEMKDLVTNYAGEVLQRAGAGYSMRVHNTGQRQAANVFPETPEASKDNLQNNTLLKVAK